MYALTPKTYDEIQGALRQMTPEGRFIGGGTDFVIKMRMGLVKPDGLCYLGYVPELKEIFEKDDCLYVGACCSMTEVEHNALVKKNFPALSDAAGDVGSLQIRNNGTIGGNIGNASPAGDILPVLYLYDAELEIMGPEGIRKAPIDEVLLGPGRLSLSYNEAITRIILPKNKDKSGFFKLGSRKKVTISRVGLALRLQLEDDVVKSMKLYVGAIGLKPVRFEDAENFMLGKPVTEENVLAVAQILSDYIKAHVAVQFDRDYKVFAVKGAVTDIFDRVCSR